MKTASIAWRNVSRQKRRAVLLGGAVGLGFFVMVLMDALTGGMTASLRENITASYIGHVYVSGSEWRESGGEVKRILDGRTVQDAIASSGLRVKAIVPKSGGDATFIYGGRQARMALAGIPWKGTESAIGEPRLSEGSLAAMEDPRAILVPTTLAARLGLKAGETVLVKAQTATGQANVVDFTVAGITDGTGGGDLFQSAYAHLEAVNGLLNLPAGACQQYNLYVEDSSGLEAQAQRLIEALKAHGVPVKARTAKAAATPLPGAGEDSVGPMASLFGGPAKTEPWQGTKYAVSTLDDAAGQFSTVVSTMRTISVVVFLALLAICMAGIVNTFRMVLIERTKEIGTLRAMGMRSREVLRLFVQEAVIMTCCGAAVGLAAALLLMPLLSLLPFPAGGALAMFLKAGHLAFSVKAANLAVYSSLVVAAGAIAALSPARSAAALKPVDALRN